MKSAREIRPPNIVPGGIYSSSALVHNLGISTNTLRKWMTNRQTKLVPLDVGTKEFLFLADTVIAFLSEYKASR